MKERKYKEDWVNETRFDGKGGRERRVPVYRGPIFRGASGQERKSMLLWASFSWALFFLLILLYWKLNFPGATVLYVFLPAGLSLFPLLYWMLGIAGLVRAPEKMTRLQKENGAGRILRSSAGCMICGFAAVLGDLIYLVSGSAAQREWPGALMLLAAAVTACGAMNYFRRVNRCISEGGNGQA